MEENFWHAKWENNQIGFHEAKPNPILIKYFHQLDLKDDSRIFVPLCGKTHDIQWILSQGHKVVGVELSDLAITQLFTSLGMKPEIKKTSNLKHYQAKNIDIFVGNFFDLTQSALGKVDAIYDRAALVALPEEEAHDLELGGLGVVGLDLGEDGLGAGDVAVVLAPGGPVDGHRLGAGLPSVGRVAVARVGVALERVLLAAGGQEVPAQTAVADTALKDHDRRIDGVAQLVPDAELGPDASAGDRHPVVVVDAPDAAAAAHAADVADIHACGPVPVVIHQVRVKTQRPRGMLQRALPVRAPHVAGPHHVGLPQPPHAFGFGQRDS